MEKITEIYTKEHEEEKRRKAKICENPENIKNKEKMMIVSKTQKMYFFL